MAKPLRGDAVKLARELARNPDTPRVVRAIRSRTPPRVTAAILETLSEAEQAKRGLSINSSTGSLVVAQAVKVPTLEVNDETTPMSLVEMARALHKARRAAPPTTHQNSTLYVLGYGKTLEPKSVPGVWRTTPAVSGRADIMRRAPSITEAEVSYMTHHGAFEGDSSFATTDSRAARIFEALCSEPNSQQIRWELKTTADDVTYGLRLAATGKGERKAAIVRSKYFGKAVELGAVLGYAGTNMRFHSYGRTFGLHAETLFAADPELLAQVAHDGVKPNETLELSGDAASYVGDYVRDNDARALAPAFTRLVIEQQIARYPQVAPANCGR